MKRLFDITQNDLRLLLRDKQTFLFLLLMPIGFTLIFGFAFGSFPANTNRQDDNEMVYVVDRDQTLISKALINMIEKSNPSLQLQQVDLSDQTIQENFQTGSTTLIISAGFTENLSNPTIEPVTILFQSSQEQNPEILAEVQKSVARLVSSTKTATVITTIFPSLTFEEVFSTTLRAWGTPPVSFSKEITGKEEGNNGISAAQTAPGMMLQFSLAGLLTAGQMIVNERKARVYDRLLTTSVKPTQILLGHYFAILSIILGQFVLLIIFGQLVLNLDYFSYPMETLIISLACALCIAAIGLLIGVLAKTDDQAIIFSLIPMFIFSGLGGAWMPLEYTSKSFQTIGHFSPVAWGMDGFKSILLYEANIETIGKSALVLIAYAIFFFTLTIILFKKKHN